MLTLNNKFYSKIDQLEIEAKKEKEYYLQQQKKFKDYEENAKHRFETIKQRQMEYEKNTNNMFSKIDFIKEIFSKITKKERIIIFSDFSCIFKEIITYLNQINVKHVSLDGGNINDLQYSIDSYKMGETPVLMSNSYMYGCGMNLPETTHLIIVHKLDCPLRKDQLIARAQRPGRKCRLKIYDLLHKNELS